MKLLILLRRVAAGLAVLFFALSLRAQTLHTTQYGVKYSFIEDKPGTNAVEGDWIGIRLSVFVRTKTGKDTLIENGEKMPDGLLTFPLKKPFFRGSFEEVFPALSLGDSVSILVEADSMLTMLSGEQPLPASFDPRTDVRMEVRVVILGSRSDFYQQQRNYRNQRALAENEAQIKAYLAKNNINATRTESGLYYQMVRKGEEPTARTGQKVRINYVTTLLNGTKVEDSREIGIPVEFVIGSGGMFPGFDEGTALLGEGGKAILYMPSHLALREQSYNRIPPYAVLIVELELADIK